MISNLPYQQHRFQKGMTLPELLAVMAIMATLMAIIVPAFNSARDNANRSADIAQMNTIQSALHQYHADHGHYPPALMGYITRYTGAQSIIPADRLQHAINGLYPGKLNNTETFRPYRNRVPAAKHLEWITAARYPNQDPRSIGSQGAILDLRGSGTKSDDSKARQAFGPQDGFAVLGENRIASLPNSPTDPRAAKFYKVSGYDVAEVPIPDQIRGKTANRVELRYALFWSKYAMQEGGNQYDDPRQLGYANPPDNTVVTWNSYFRDWQSGNKASQKRPSNAKKDIVLFLSGAAKSFRSDVLFDRSWRVLPSDG
jgi:prepilin-type N-terminal cleavage/methylation domain-containing protein